MHSKKFLPILLPALFLTPSFLLAAPGAATLESDSLAAKLDTAWPRIIAYKHKPDGAVFHGQLAAPEQKILLNGKPAQCKVAFKQTGKNTAVYNLAFPDARAAVSLHIEINKHDVLLRMDKPSGPGAETLLSITFPDNALLTLNSGQPGAEIATAFATAGHPHHTQKSNQRIGPLAKQKTGDETGNYFFAAAGGLAAGIADNHDSDRDRVCYTIAKENDKTICRARNCIWAFRAPEAPDDPLPLPFVRVFIAPDLNHDGKATWQDAALVYRQTMPKPYGSESLPDIVADQIAMNFASGAQQPFLRLLDEIKKIYLATDGISQQILIKGFSAEGHDSANTDYGGHYNNRAGGLRDLAFLEKHAPEWNARVGIHINATEVYPEAHRYDPKILEYDKNGNPVPGWRWLDQSYMIDKVKDTAGGTLSAALDQMRREQPDLSFVYVDTYWAHGWTALKLAEKINSLKLPLYTEGNASLDPWAVWTHWRGGMPAPMKFLWYSQRDIFPNDPILREPQHRGYLSWHNEFAFSEFIRGVFAQNLPAKYLKHFDLLAWTPGKSARFSGGVEVERDGNTITCTRNGRPIMSWDGKSNHNRLFVPWPPENPEKIYVWDETETLGAWPLPPSWGKPSEVFLYRLTQLGRVGETRLPVENGKVSPKVEKSTPYVIYPKPAPKQKPMVWGEGSPVENPGFDSHDLTGWTPTPAEAPKAPSARIRVEPDKNANPRLVVAPGKEAAVSQEITGLKPGATYTASVWAQGPERPVGLEILPLGIPGAKPVSNTVARTNVKHRAPCDRRNDTLYQKLRVKFTMPAGSSKIRLALRAGKGPGTAEFDDVRLVRSNPPPPEAKGHWYFEDFEDFDQNWGPFSWISGEHTHLSETHHPYTKDTIRGQFSFKTMNEGNGQVARSTPATLAFKPNTRYRIHCKTLLGKGASYQLQIKEGQRVLCDMPIPPGRSAVEGEFTTLGSGDACLVLMKKSGGMCVLDDIAIDEIGK